MCAFWEYSKKSSVLGSRGSTVHETSEASGRISLVMVIRAWCELFIADFFKNQQFTQE